ncbi:Hypothetical protein NTJ_03835 [Nesidiocoris tenuis]|uniref:Uncharacterized protein n=1 Tax=Nesidiocoris tenuis TaxID=355587 RepID=A0ABN7AFG3_9HEMI|nr:Hypothetical protein NTJ_03835 [Nesidiocoris tenuis]
MKFVTVGHSSVAQIIESSTFSPILVIDPHQYQCFVITVLMMRKSETCREGSLNCVGARVLYVEWWGATRRETMNSPSLPPATTSESFLAWSTTYHLEGAKRREQFLAASSFHSTIPYRKRFSILPFNSRRLS